MRSTHARLDPVMVTDGGSQPRIAGRFRLVCFFDRERVMSVACPAIRKVRAECLTAWAQLMEALVAEHRPARPVPPMAGTVAIGAVVHLLATAIEEGRDLSSMSGILADTAYRLLLA
ncbi:hypothetical protein [Streptomyces sioyaensis]|uniref:hypothetical protein n=1 Tax=Streptomyces sioyaensis TaxID=67364 RepID=UPI0037BB6FB7